MAALVKSFVRLGCNASRFITVRSISTTNIHHGIYNKTYQDPTFLKEDLMAPLEEHDERRYQPIKAAKTDEFSSNNFDPVVQKFIRMLMRNSDKKLARHLVDKTFESIKFIQVEKYHKASSDLEKELIELNPAKLFHQAVNNCKPLLILQETRRGGTVYQVPIPTKPKYQEFKAMKWLIESGREKDKSVRFYDKLAIEIVDAAKNEGKSIRKKQELHRVCEANRAYAHYRW